MKSARVAALVTIALLATGCAVGDGAPLPTESTPGAAGRGVVVAPTLDPESGLWLSDGWPVPAPDATFDPLAPSLSSSEAAQLLMGCLNEKGWDATVDPESWGVVVDVPPAQQEAHMVDYKACLVEHAIGTQPGPPLTEELARSEYAAQERTRACIVREGQPAPELPSYRVYEELLLAGGIYSIYTEAGFPQSVRDLLLAACPDPIDTWGRNG